MPKRVERSREGTIRGNYGGHRLGNHQMATQKPGEEILGFRVSYWNKRRMGGKGGREIRKRGKKSCTPQVLCVKENFSWEIYFDSCRRNH